MKDTIVLAYSGGLDTSVALRWLADEYDADVIALLIDVGQGIDADAVIARAEAAGVGENDRVLHGVSSCSRVIRRIRS